MTVESLLEDLSAREITEWQAFEFVYGPLGSSYGDDLLAGIYEQLQAFNRGPDDPEVERFPRRHEYMQYLRDIYEAQVDEESKTDEDRAAEIASFGAEIWG